MRGGRAPARDRFAPMSSLVHVRCNTLWIGPSIGRLERACMRSVLRHGHELTLYCYDEPAGVPEGVELRDAADVLPRDEIVRHHTGSVSLFSNRFRYELQRLGSGVWLDADVYMVASLDDARPHLFGLYETDVVNGAVLRLPADSPLLAELLELVEERRVPSWLPWGERRAARRRLRATGRAGLAEMPWGSAGPHALTALARRHRLLGAAAARAVFYPVHWLHADWLRDPAVRLDDVIRTQTVAVHLWNERIKEFKERPAAPGSFLARLHDEGGAA